jgi:hypothetical protein
VGEIMAAIRAFFPDISATTDAGEVDKLTRRSFERADLDYCIADAARAADGFTINEDTCAQHCTEFDELGGDIEALVERKKAVIAGNRLSADRVRTALSIQNPYFDRVMRVAQHGIVVSDLLPPDFEPSGPQRDKWPPQRSKFIRAAPAVEKLLQENFLDKGLAVVLDSRRAQTIKGLSVHPSGWAPKAGKVYGRNTGDPASMNTEFTGSESYITPP